MQTHTCTHIHTQTQTHTHTHTHTHRHTYTQNPEMTARFPHLVCRQCQQQAQCRKEVGLHRRRREAVLRLLQVQACVSHRHLGGVQRPKPTMGNPFTKPSVGSESASRWQKPADSMTPPDRQLPRWYSLLLVLSRLFGPLVLAWASRLGSQAPRAATRNRSRALRASNKNLLIIGFLSCFSVLYHGLATLLSQIY